MKKVILGATGSIGSSLAKKLAESGEGLHLVGRDESSLSALANELNSTFTVCDVLEENFSDINGIIGMRKKMDHTRRIYRCHLGVNLLAKIKY